MRIKRRRKCLHCKELFLPDPRNSSRQRYCSLPACRTVSKAASQRKWLSKPENRSYFLGPVNTKRVQQWRKRNPGYWRKRGEKQIALQDSLIRETTIHQEVTLHLRNNTLQDLLSAQPIVFLGLLAHLTGSPLQDDIATICRRLQQLGQDILSETFCPKGGQYDSQQNSCLSTQNPPDP